MSPVQIKLYNGYSFLKNWYSPITQFNTFLWDGRTCLWDKKSFICTALFWKIHIVFGTLKWPADQY